MRAILVGVRNSVNATSQAIMFTSSLEVSATMMSASAVPAASSTEGWAALPATVRTSSRSWSSRSTSSFTSTTVTSLASSRERWSAAVRPARLPLLGAEASHGERARHLDARPHLLDQVLGDLAHEARDLAVAVDAVQPPLLGAGEVQLPHGARHADVGEPPLLLEPVEVGERALMREQALLHAGEEHHRELEALGGVQRHHLHAVLPLVR